jgi:23S rRNA pseudouridine955/2504/2580 synthase
MKLARSEPSVRVQYLEVDADHAGQRLDNYLFASCKGVPKSHLYRLVRQGQIRINRGRRPVDYRLQVGDVVRIPPLRMALRATAVAEPTSLEDRIVYEDDDLLAIDKPAGLAVHGGSGVRLGLIEALRARYSHPRFLELVHRLDRDTSGCLLVAKRRSALLALHAALRAGRVEKRYAALVRDHWTGRSHQISASLQKFRLRSGERMVEVSGGGKEALTRFIPKRQFADSTLVEIELLTGRTHQARVHAAYAGHPVAGDQRYGDREFNRKMRERGLRTRRQRFCAVSLPRPPTSASLIRVQPPRAI